MEKVVTSFFFFNDTATTEIYTLSLHDALPIYEVATAEHLSRVETFLIDFRTRPESPEFSAEAHDLLGTPRLLLDSRRVTDPRPRKLLEDLELVLTQIAALDSHDRREDLDFIADGLDRSHVRTRLRNAIPAGPAIRM